MFEASALAGPRSGVTVTASASSSWSWVLAGCVLADGSGFFVAGADFGCDFSDAAGFGWVFSGGADSDRVFLDVSDPGRVFSVDPPAAEPAVRVAPDPDDVVSDP